jgi:hypothetical protein
MTLIAATPVQPLTPEQVYEIRSMAEGGQFADALIRLRKIKSSYPKNTFFVALEKQLERLLVLPRDTEPSDIQKKELIGSLPGLIHGAVESMRHQQPVHAAPVEAHKPHTERIDRETARTQLKEQYFHHADEYLKKGAYGSALVEIRRVKIIAPDDQTAIEYERTIHQLVELHQRNGIQQQEPAPQVKAEEASPVPFAAEEQVKKCEPGPAIESDPTRPRQPEQHPTRQSRSKAPFVALAVLCALVIMGGAAALLFTVFSAPDAAPQKQPAVLQVARQTPRVENPISKSDGNAVTPQPPGASGTPTPNATAGPQAAAPGSPSGSGASEQKAEIVPPVVRQENAPPVKAGAASAMVAAGKTTEIVPPVVRQENAPPAKAGAASAMVAAGKTEEKDKVRATTVTERNPEIVRLEQPVFPPEALAASGSAEVIIMVQIDQDGKPVKSLIAKSSNEALNPAVTAAAMNSVYRAGTTAKGPATKWLTIPFQVK